MRLSLTAAPQAQTLEAGITLQGDAKPWVLVWLCGRAALADKPSAAAADLLHR